VLVLGEAAAPLYAVGITIVELHVQGTQDR